MNQKAYRSHTQPHMSLIATTLILLKEDVPSLRSLTDSLESVVAINNYGRSGSVFLQSLLDWHPDTISTPGIYLSKFYPFFEKFGSLTASQLIDQFIHDFEIMFDARRPCLAYSPSMDAGESCGFTNLGKERNQSHRVDRQLFRSYMFEILADCDGPVPRKLFFKAIHVAYRGALGQPGRLHKNMRIVYPLHTPIPSKYTEQFAEDFPDAKCVLMVRRPIDTTESMVRHLKRRGEICFFLYGFLYQSLFGGASPAPQLDCKAVRLEDLHSSPLETMQRLCAWLDLEMDDSLVQSTINGKEWWGDSDSLGVNGFNPSVVAYERHRGQVTAIDRFRMNVLLAKKNAKWGYEVAPADRSILRRLMILPLLFLPFVMEIDFLRAERNERMRGTISGAAAEPLPRPLMSLLWRFGAGTILRYLDIRRSLIVAWCEMFDSSGSEVQLL